MILYRPTLDSERIGDDGLEHWLLRRRAARKKGRQALERMGVRVRTGLRELADNRAEKVGLTRFFRNPRVTADEILRTAAARTGAAAAGRHVLLIEDTSEINYEAKAKRKRGLGRVGNGKDVGLFVHPALAVDAADGGVLGLAGAVIWRRTRVKGKDYQSQPIEEKESNSGAPVLERRRARHRHRRPGSRHLRAVRPPARRKDPRVGPRRARSGARRDGRAAVDG